MPSNPATSVRGPKYSYTVGKTPVLSADDTRALLDSIPIIYRRDSNDSPTPHVVGLRDRALIALMTFSFARVGAVTGMKVDDYFQNGKRWFVRLHERAASTTSCPSITRPRNTSTPISTRPASAPSRRRRSFAPHAAVQGNSPPTRYPNVTRCAPSRAAPQISSATTPKFVYRVEFAIIPSEVPHH